MVTSCSSRVRPREQEERKCRWFLTFGYYHMNSARFKLMCPWGERRRSVSMLPILIFSGCPKQEARRTAEWLKCTLISPNINQWQLKKRTCIISFCWQKPRILHVEAKWHKLSAQTPSQTKHTPSHPDNTGPPAATKRQLLKNISGRV